jgi:hypothetical protein
MTLLVFIWMSMAVIPVLRLLLLVRLRVFVRTLVVFREELTPGVIFVVIPVVIILVRPIVNAPHPCDSLLAGVHLDLRLVPRSPQERRALPPEKQN